MPLTEQEALDAARRFLKRARRDLPYPVSDVPVRQKLVQNSESQRWEFYFEYQPPPSLFVDPTCARVFVDSVTGETALFSPHDQAT